VFALYPCTGISYDITVVSSFTWLTGEVARTRPTHKYWGLSLHVQIPGFISRFYVEIY